MVQTRLKTSGGKQKRSAVRASLPAVQARLWSLGESRSTAQSVTMMNISAGGALLQADNPLAVGEMVHCTFVLPGGGPFSLAAQIVRCAPATAGGGHDVAIAFSMNQSNENHLVRWVFCWVAMQERMSLRTVASVDALKSPLPR